MVSAARPSAQRYATQERGDRTRPGRSHPRYVVLTQLLEKLTAIATSDWLAPGEVVLDYGCGNRPYATLFGRKFSRYLGADFAGNPDADIIIRDSGELPLPDESVDCVLSTQVLEHVEHPEKYLAEAWRVLRPDGALVLSTHGVWRYHPDPTDYWRWTVDGLQIQIYRAGFNVWSLHSVLSLASCGLQLWQDAAGDYLPRRLRPIYFWLVQSVIDRIERRQNGEVSSDASVYIVFAKKRAQGEALNG